MSRVSVLEFSYYEQSELQRIAALSAERLGYTISPDAAAMLAGAAWGEARRVNHLLRTTSDELIAFGLGNRIEAGHVRDTFARLRLQPDGLTETQIALLKHLSTARNRRLGLRTLAGMLAKSERDIAIRLEPVLLRRGFINIVSGGREISTDGLGYLATLDGPSPIIRPPFPETDFVSTARGI